LWCTQVSQWYRFGLYDNFRDGDIDENDELSQQLNNHAIFYKSILNIPLTSFNSLTGCNVPSLNCFPPAWISQLLDRKRDEFKTDLDSELGLSEFVAGLLDKWVFKVVVDLLMAVKAKGEFDYLLLLEKTDGCHRDDEDARPC